MRAWLGVTYRPKSAFRFFRAFSLAGDPGPAMGKKIWNNFWRSFSTCYFFTLLRFLVMSGKVPEPENFGDQFLYWEKRLEAGNPFIAGETPDSVDLMLFGIIQCHSSIPVPPLEALQEDPRLNHLRDWIGRMQTRLADYPYFYSPEYFKPAAEVRRPATLFDQSIFWLGTAFMLVMLPLTLAMMFFAYRTGRRQAKRV